MWAGFEWCGKCKQQQEFETECEDDNMHVRYVGPVEK